MTKSQRKQMAAAVLTAVGRIGGVGKTALAVGVARQSVSRWQSGEAIISAENAVALADEAGMAKADFRPDLWGSS